MLKEKIQKGTVKADDKYHITVTDDGPILVYGKPPLAQQFIIPDEMGFSWEFRRGDCYPMEEEPTKLCRCGKSRERPYCDSSHDRINWDPELTAENDAIFDGVKIFDGPGIELTDNKKYCVFARFCDAKGRVWNLVRTAYDKESVDIAIHEANHCPSARLSVWDKKTGEPFEPELEPSLGLIEDPKINVSAGLWVRGGIPVRKENGETYEIRNRVVLCRCGASKNKPYCDGMHVQVKFKDGLG